MSTRSQIGFYRSSGDPLDKFEALIYKHCDGYPEGTLPFLEPWAQKFQNTRGLSDAEYAAANCLRELMNFYEANGETGYGISNAFHGDIEYFYAVDPKGIRVYAVPYDAKPQRWTLERTIDIPSATKRTWGA